MVRAWLWPVYGGKKVVRLVQLDGHKVGGGDDIMPPDEDGHCLMGGETYELRNISGSPHLPVRAEIYEDAEKQEVAALLRKMADWVERAWDDSLSRKGQERLDKELRKMLEDDNPFNPPKLRRIK
jgi:hypothetical protein